MKFQHNSTIDLELPWLWYSERTLLVCPLYCLCEYYYFFYWLSKSLKNCQLTVKNIRIRVIKIKLKKIHDGTRGTIGCPRKNVPIFQPIPTKWGHFFWDTLYISDHLCNQCTSEIICIDKCRSVLITAYQYSPVFIWFCITLS